MGTPAKKQKKGHKKYKVLKKWFEQEKYVDIISKA